MLLSDFLDNLLDGKKIDFKITKTKVLLFPKRPSAYQNGDGSNSTHTISGYVKNSANGEELIGATIYIQDLNIGTSTNVYGFYSLTVPEGYYSVQYSYIGFKASEIIVDLNQSKKLNVEIIENTLEIDEVVVKARRKDHNIKSVEVGSFKITPKEIAAVPILFGEQDLMKTIQLMPGIKSAGEGSSGFNVRGGGTDQNLVILDEATVYNASHLLGFFSVFNSDAIKDVKMIKGGGPAEYGGRLSSVLDIKMNEGNMRKHEVSGGLGLISSRLTLQGPIVKEKGSFIISGRRTYIDLFFPLFSDESASNTKLYFYDLNMKANYIINEKNRIYMSGYFGRDVFNFDDVFGFDWGNATGTIRWNHLFSDKLFLNSSLIISNYDYDLNMNVDEFKMSIYSGINDMNIKEDFSYYINPKNTLKFGANAIYHTFRPGEISGNENFNSFVLEKDYAYEIAGYISHELKLINNLQLDYGLRYSLFMVMGPGDVYSYDADNNVTDTISYKSNEIIKTYGGLEPRFAATYSLNNKSSVKLAYSRSRQNLHLLSNSTAGTPMDAWIPSSSIVKSGIADQISIGYFRNFNDNQIETSVEIYYKDLKNQIDFENGANLFFNPHIESQIVFGKGRSYGAEFLIKKTSGKLTGWIGYTYSKTEKKFDEVNNGSWYPTKYDRLHDVSIVGMYQFNKKWNMSATWVYYTGNAVTFPSGKYEIEGNTVGYYTERNGYRMPDYHRLDIGATYTKQKKKGREASWNFSLYNAYGRKNAYSIRFQESEADPTKTEAVRMTLFTWVPSITYNFKF
ncbi:MAG: hypothetical protein C0597_01675 [Marinilabiliales bacterium]|nr:MAG: hypothetical protein C0597_01675 [Marinilabiliales bacterium]